MLDEAYVDRDGVTNPVPDQGSDWIVPDGSFFVLGDSRTSAADSRSAYGFVPNGALLGRVLNRCGPSERRGPVT
jgi:signal peptidase I